MKKLRAEIAELVEALDKMSTSCNKTQKELQRPDKRIKK